MSKEKISHSDYTYDAKFKQLFTNRVFLTPILKNIIPEYKDCALEEIEPLIQPHGDTRVNPQAYNIEDTGKDKETVTRYDVLIDCTLPKRGIYYCCRLISRQIENLGKESYNQLKPVYSVWILINDIPEEMQNTVYTAGLSGRFQDEQKDASKLNEEIDLIHLSLIYLSENFKVEEGQSDLIKYLQSVFLHEVDNSQYNPYHTYSRKVKEEVDEMMTIRESFEARGEAQGEARGKVIGEARGELKGVIWFMLEENKSDVEIIKCLSTRKRNPLTEEQARKALEDYRRENP